jgi:hypothetical protein
VAAAIGSELGWDESRAQQEAALFLQNAEAEGILPAAFMPAG